MTYFKIHNKATSETKFAYGFTFEAACAVLHWKPEDCIKLAAYKGR